MPPAEAEIQDSDLITKLCQVIAQPVPAGPDPITAIFPSLTRTPFLSSYSESKQSLKRIFPRHGWRSAHRRLLGYISNSQNEQIYPQIPGKGFSSLIRLQAPSKSPSVVLSINATISFPPDRLHCKAVSCFIKRTLRPPRPRLIPLHIPKRNGDHRHFRGAFESKLICHFDYPMNPN